MSAAKLSELQFILSSLIEIAHSMQFPVTKPAIHFEARLLLPDMSLVSK